MLPAEIIAELIKLRPDTTVRLFRDRYPGGAAPFIETYIDGLRKAGLPEG